MKQLLTILICSLSLSAQAQIQKVLHQTFDLDSIDVITFDLYGEYEVETWAGSKVLSETTIKLYQASPSVLKFFIEVGRYEIEGHRNVTSLILSSKDKERKAIKTSKGEVTEIVELKLFLPDTFAKTGEWSWRRVEPLPEEKNR